MNNSVKEGAAFISGVISLSLSISLAAHRIRHFHLQTLFKRLHHFQLKQCQ